MKTALALTAVAALALTVATPAQAMSPAPIHQTDTTITQAALACGIGRTRVGGVCVSRIAKRHARRQVRRDARWN